MVKNTSKQVKTIAYAFLLQGLVALLFWMCFSNGLPGVIGLYLGLAMSYALTQMLENS